jgi:predicted nucleotidyltransferase
MYTLPSKVKNPPASANQRKQVALAIAEQCRQVLTQEFGASDVILFGSLRGDGPWHNDSDLDLAVCGISKKALLLAHHRLEAVVPSWLPFDLVALERTDERVRDRILQLTPLPENMYLALKFRLKEELTAMEQTIDTLNALLSQAEAIPDIALIPAAAGYTEDFYAGCERLAERVAVVLDNGLPEGRNWHELLLQQMAKPGKQGRPPLWEPSLLQELDVYRSFCHRVRHLYSVELDRQRVLELAQQVPLMFGKIQKAIERFNEWLVQQAESRS